jgi:hypothetical protein
MAFPKALPRAALLLLAGGLLAGGVAQATPIAFSGTLGAGSTAFGSVLAESGPFGSGDNWSFWRFSAPFWSRSRSP